MKTLISRILPNLYYGNTERIAVIIPVYNLTAYLEETLRSVIAQKYPYKEIIVVDDGSADDAAGEIKRICNLFPGVVLIHQEHIGPAAARSKGTAHTSAEHILYLDADDVMLPGTLKYLATGLRKNPTAVAVYGQRILFEKERGFMPQHIGPKLSGSKVLYQLLEGKYPFCNGSICIRRNALEEISPDNHTTKHGEDWLLWCHLALIGDIICLGKRPVLHYRLHNTSFSNEVYRDPSVFIATYNSVFVHPEFVAAVGKDTLLKLKEKCLSRVYLKLSRIYAEHGQLELAAQYLEKITVPLASLSHNAQSTFTE